MKLIILCLDAANMHHPFPRVSRRFESVYTLQGKNLTTPHTWAMRAPRVATVHNDYQRVELSRTHLTLVPSSTHMPWRTHRGWPEHSHCTPMKYGGMSSNPATVEATQFGDTKKSHMHSYISNACSFEPNRHGH
jgi:hypothetical protein